MTANKHQKHIDTQDCMGDENVFINTKPVKVMETGSGRIYIYTPRTNPTEEDLKKFYRKIMECLLSAEKVRKNRL